MNIEGKKILITGAAKRVGRVIAEKLASQGAVLAVHYHRSGDEASDVCRSLKEKGASVCTVQADLTAEEACEKLIRETCSLLGGLDVLVNNAAVFMADDLVSLCMERALNQMMVNCWAPVLLSRQFAICCSSGRIINILDQRIARHKGDRLSYTLSKKALGEATKMLALELAPRFTVNAVAPGAVLVPETIDGTRVRERAGCTPLNQSGSPDDVADAVRYLVESDSITGQILYVDGGQHLL